MTNEVRAKKLKKLRGQYAAVMKHANKISKDIDAVIALCPHDDYHRQADPSGGNDHAYTCKTCGKEW